MQNLSGFAQIVIFAIAFSAFIAICSYLSYSWKADFEFLGVLITYTFLICANALALIFGIVSTLYLLLFREENSAAKKLCMAVIIIVFVCGWGRYLIKCDKNYLAEAKYIFETVDTKKGFIDKLILVNGARQAYLSSMDKHIHDNNCKDLNDFRSHIPVTIDRDYSLEKLLRTMTGNYSRIYCKNHNDRSFTR